MYLNWWSRSLWLVRCLSEQTSLVLTVIFHSDSRADLTSTIWVTYFVLLTLVPAASIGQVYKARLLKNGQLVAIKIQRPNTEEIVALDLYVLRWWGGVYNAIFRLLGRDINLQSVMDDFGKLLYAEIDYVAEAANARRFSELYAKDVAIADVFVPKVYSELTTRKVLTMEWVDGFRLTDNENLELYNLDRKKLVDTLVQCKWS